MRPGPFKPRSSRLARGQIKRGGRIKPKKRTASEFARVYGSRARVAWVKSQPCVVAFRHTCFGAIENAHTATGGMGRKADAETIVPLCAFHHLVLHNNGVRTFQRQYRVNLPALAAQVEIAWRAHLNLTAV